MNRHLNRAGNLLLLFLGVFPQIYLITDSLDCHIQQSIVLWIAVLCVLVWIAASFRRGILIGMPLAALTLYLAYRSYGENPAAQLMDLFDRITGVYYEHVYSPGSSYAYSSAVSSHSLLLVFLAFLLAAYLASALTARTGRIPLTLLGVIPITGACLSVNGAPSSLVVLPFLLFMILLLVSGNVYLENGSYGRNLFVVLLPVTILLCALLLAYAPERYHQDARDAALSQRLEQLTSAFSRWLDQMTFEARPSEREVLPPAEEIPDGGSPANLPYTGWGEIGADLDLTQDFDFDVLGKTVLYASADTDGMIYLRLFSYGDYTGTGWLIAANAPVDSSLSFTAQALSGQANAQAHAVQIRTEQRLPYLCLPYYSISAQHSDTCVPAVGQSSYTADYVSDTADFGSLQVPPVWRDAEAAYRAYAHAYYTRLPDQTAAELRQLCADAGIRTMDLAVIDRIAAYVQQTCEYDLHTEPYPSTDYAVYFLTQAQRGYCVHFATAAAALYRCLGIPARVTVGYLLDARKDQTVEVTEAEAHAWVEIYQDGLGWVPVEVTGQGGAREEDTTEPESSISAASESTPEPGDPALAEAGSAESDPGTLPVGVLSGEEQSEQTSSSDARRTLRHWLPTLLFLGLLAAALPLWHLAARALVQRSYHQKDRRKAAVALYRSAVYAAKLGAELPAEIRICAEKASFSRHEVTQEELKQNISLLQALLEELYPKLRFLEKLRLKYGKGLL